MARRKKQEGTTERVETRKEMLRRRKDTRERRVLLATMGPLLAAVVGLLVVGTYYNLYRLPRTPIARVGDETITTAQLSQRLQWERFQFVNQIQSIQQLLSTSDPSIMQQFSAGWEQQRANLPQDTVDKMVDEALTRQEAEKRGITVSDDEVRSSVGDELATAIAPQPTEPPAEGAEGGEEAEGAEGDADEATTVPTPEPATTEEIDEAFERYVQGSLTRTGLTEDEYIQIRKQEIYRERLTEALAEEQLSTSEPQVEMAYMRFVSAETARAAHDALVAGAAWDDVVAQFERPEPTPTAEPEPADDAADEGDEEAAAEGETATEDEVAAEDEEATEDEVAEQDETASEDDTATGDEAEADDAAADEPAEDTDVTGDDAATEDEPAEDVVEDAAEDEDAAEGEEAAGDEDAVEGEDEAATVTPAESATPAPTITPAPTSTPVPFSAEVGNRRWSTSYGLKDNLRDDQAAIDAVMALGPNAFTEPLVIGTEHFVVYVFDVDDDRAVPEEELEKRETEIFDPWLTDHRVERSGDISKFPLEGKVPEEPQWFVDSFGQLLQTVPPTFDPAALQVTTSEPEPAPTLDGGGTAP